MVADHLPKHHDDAVGVQEAGGVPLVQSHLRLHRCPGAVAEVVTVGLRAGNLQKGRFHQENRSEISASELPLIT